VTGVPSGLGPGVELVVYRTVQEALTNVLKHARHPTRVRVALMYGSEQTVIEVEDDGAGLPAGSDQRAGDRHGLTGMAERVAAYGDGCTCPGRPPAGDGACARRPDPERPGPERAAMTTIRVAIVDDQDLVRTGLRMILEDCLISGSWRGIRRGAGGPARRSTGPT
jgi:hypothetical protein